MSRPEIFERVGSATRQRDHVINGQTHQIMSAQAEIDGALAEVANCAISSNHRICQRFPATGAHADGNALAAREIALMAGQCGAAVRAIALARSRRSDNAAAIGTCERIIPTRSHARSAASPLAFVARLELNPACLASPETLYRSAIALGRAKPLLLLSSGIRDEHVIAADAGNENRGKFFASPSDALGRAHTLTLGFGAKRRTAGFADSAAVDPLRAIADQRTESLLSLLQNLSANRARGGWGILREHFRVPSWVPRRECVQHCPAPLFSPHFTTLAAVPLSAKGV